jgi:hypothetical protein
MSCLSCFIFFWNTKYNSPHTFCLASYSVMFHDLCTVLLQPTDHLHCIRALRCDPSNQYTTLSHTCWQIGFVWKSAPPVTFHCPVFLAARRTMFFPIHLLHSYIHRSYQWTLSRDSEQACLHEPQVALVCRHSSFGSIARLILRRRRTAYRTINCPMIYYM